jgi:hypothetical protein
MLAESSFEISGYACIERAITTFRDVDMVKMGLENHFAF